MKANILMVAGLVALAMSSQAHAADGKITFNGKVVKASCDVSASAKDFTVNLPSISTSAIGSTLGDKAGHTAFSIKLENCESQTTEAEKVRIAFVGTSDENNVYVLKNTAASNAATGVGLQLLQQDGSTIIDINNGSNKDKQYTIPAKGENPAALELHYNVAYVNTSGSAVTTGDVAAVATYSVEYN